MILLLSSLGCDVQTRLLKNELERRGIETLVIDTHALHKKDISVSLSSKGEVKLSINKKNIVLEKIILTTNPRTDAILYSPSSILYPMEWRYRIGSFLREFIDLFEEQCYPGTFSAIQQGESKMKVMRYGTSTGLNIPTISQISFNEPKGYRFIKPLGFPFIVSNTTNNTDEVCVTSFGGMAKNSDPLKHYPNMSQTPIQAQYHLRCFATTEKVFTSSRKVLKGEKLIDLRQLNESENFNPIWSETILSKKTDGYLKKLLKSMSLKWACPEFLVDKQGKEIFIDLNPCGDWYGFFQKKTRREIVGHLGDLILR